jgi:uncharacterized membrane protein
MEYHPEFCDTPFVNRTKSVEGGINMESRIVDPHKSSIGELDANIMVLIVYLGGIVIGLIPGIKVLAWAVPLVILLMEKNSTFVKFHAVQALILSAVGAILGIIVTVFAGISIAIPGIGLALLSIIGLVALLITIVMVVFLIIAAVNGYAYKEYMIPVIGPIAYGIIYKNTNM